MEKATREDPVLNDRHDACLVGLSNQFELNPFPGLSSQFTIQPNHYSFIQLLLQLLYQIPYSFQNPTDFLDLIPCISPHSHSPYLPTTDLPIIPISYYPIPTTLPYPLTKVLPLTPCQHTTPPHRSPTLYLSSSFHRDQNDNQRPQEMIVRWPHSQVAVSIKSWSPPQWTKQR